MTTDGVARCRSTEPERRPDLRWILALIGAAIVARAPGLFRVGLWRDEAATYLYATAATPAAFIALIRHVEANPPGYFYLMYLWTHAFGPAPAVMKLPTFVFALVLLWLTYELGRRLHCAQVGVCAAILVAATPLSTFVSLEARAYALAACLFTLIFILYHKACASPTPRVLLFLSITVAVAPYVHYTAIPFLIAIGLVTVGRVALAWRIKIRVLLALAVGALPFAPWLPSLLTQQQARTSMLGNANSPTEAVRLFARQIISIPPGPAGVVIVVLGVLAAFILVRLRAGRSCGVPVHALAISLLTIAFIASLNWQADTYYYPVAPLLIVCGMGYASEASLFAFSSFSRLAWAANLVLPAVTALMVLAELPMDARLLQHSFSGIPALVARAKKTGDDTFYVLAPDYIDSTFVYYDRLDGAPPLHFAAFARQDRPEFFRYFDDYAKVWNSADLVARSEQRYLRDARGARFLVVVAHSDRPETRAMPIRSKTDALLRAFRRNLQAVDRWEFPGTLEALEVYRFRLPASSALRHKTAIPGEIPRSRSVGT